jgi:hypothetical protein
VGVRLLWLVLLWLLLLCPTSALADASGAARFQLSTGLDTNPGRDFGDAATPDAVASLAGQLQGQLRQDAILLEGSYELGGRAFASSQDADLWVQAARASASWAPWTALTFGVEGRAKDRHAGSRGRGYADLFGGPFVAVFPTPALSFELHADAHRFLYRDAFAYSFGAGELSLLARYQPTRRHGVSLSLLATDERYASPAVSPGGDDLGFRRGDTRLGAAVEYRYRGPFALAVGYGFQSVASNSFGEAQRSHRLTASLGLRLPERLMLFLEGALQLTQYPDGVYLSPQILLLEDDENLSSASARLVRPVNAHLDLELRYGLYQTTLPQNGLHYLRQLATAGATLRF